MTKLNEITDGDGKLEKIIIVTSKNLKSIKRYQDSMGRAYTDDCDVAGKLIFLADKKRYEKFNEWMKEVGQWENMDEVYIFDRYHKNGDDMIERASMKLHEYSWTITLKDKYKECWFGGEVSGCQLWKEHRLDPKNIRW
jgi:hypothetical protein